MSNVKSYLKEAILKIGSRASTYDWRSINIFNKSDIVVDDTYRWNFTYTAPADGYFRVFVQQGKTGFDYEVGCDIFVSILSRLTWYLRDNSAEVYVAKGDAIKLDLFNIKADVAQGYGQFIYSKGGYA